MVMLLTRMHEIKDREGFEIEVFRKTKKGRRPILNRENGVLGPYPYRKKLKDSKTVNDWKNERFKRAYPGYTCNVLKGNGAIAANQTTLKTIRKTY
jgi:hypothetical protein